MRKSFNFLNPGKLVDGDLELVLVKKIPANPAKKHVPCYQFQMRKVGGTGKIGNISLRVGSARHLQCPGHMGYKVHKRSRGRRYAARSIQLLFPLALAHGMKSIWITCDPKNMASRRTIELAGGRYIETVRTPKEHEMYAQRIRVLRRYRIDKRTMSSKTTGGDPAPAGRLSLVELSGDPTDPPSVRAFELCYFLPVSFTAIVSDPENHVPSTLYPSRVSVAVGGSTISFIAAWSNFATRSPQLSAKATETGTPLSVRVPVSTRP